MQREYLEAFFFEVNLFFIDDLVCLNHFAS